MEIFNIAKNVNLLNLSRTDSEIFIDSSYTIKWIDSQLEGIELKSIYRPYKTLNYFRNRYSKHPIYKYRFLGIYKGNKIISIWATRTIIINSSKVITRTNVYNWTIYSFGKIIVYAM